MTARMWNFKKLFIRQLASTCRIFMDKGMHGRNLLKTARTEAAKQVLGLCPICKQPDSQYHWLMECSCSAANRIRYTTTQEISKAINDMMDVAVSKPKWKVGRRQDVIENVGRAITYALENHPHGYLLRVGRLTTAFLKHLRQLLRDINPARHYRWQWTPYKTSSSAH